MVWVGEVEYPYGPEGAQPPGAESLFTPDDVVRMSDTSLEQIGYQYDGIRNYFKIC